MFIWETDSTSLINVPQHGRLLLGENEPLITATYTTTPAAGRTGQQGLQDVNQDFHCTILVSEYV